MLRLTPLDSETGWTGELWLKTNLYRKQNLNNLSKEEIIDKLSENDNKCKSEKDLKKKELCILESIKNDNNNDQESKQNLKQNVANRDDYQQEIDHFALDFVD